MRKDKMGFQIKGNTNCFRWLRKGTAHDYINAQRSRLNRQVIFYICWISLNITHNAFLILYFGKLHVYVTINEKRDAWWCSCCPSLCFVFNKLCIMKYIAMIFFTYILSLPLYSLFQQCHQSNPILNSQNFYIVVFALQNNAGHGLTKLRN